MLEIYKQNVGAAYASSNGKTRLATPFLFWSLLLNGCVGLLCCIQEVEASAEAIVKSVQVVRIEGSDAFKEIRSLGSIEVKERSSIGFVNGGLIETLDLFEGDEVFEGQLIAQLDTEQLELEEALARQRSLATLAALERWRLALQRGETLFENKQIPLEDIEVLRLSYESANRESKADKIRADLAHLMLKQASLHSPFDGFVSKKYFNENENVAPGVPILELISKDSIVARGSIPDWMQEHLAISQTVHISLSEGSRYFSGQISALDSVIDPASRSLGFEVSFSTPPSLKPGSAVNITICAQLSAVTRTVPTKAILRTPTKGTYILVVDKSDGVTRARTKPVEIGEFTEVGITIMEGAEAGDLVVVEGHHRLVDGDVVNIKTQSKQRRSFCNRLGE